MTTHRTAVKGVLLRFAMLGIGVLGMLNAAHADIVISNPSGSGSNAGYDNVLYNGPSDITSGGDLIRGHTQTDNYLLDFLGNEPLVVTGGGQARIEAVDGEFTDLLISLYNPPGGIFTQIKFVLDAATAGNVSITGTDGNGVLTSATFGMTTNGNEWFTVVAINGENIRSVAIDSSFAGGATLSDIEQVRVGGVGTVPEPGSLCLVATMLVIGLVLRRVSPHKIR